MTAIQEHRRRGGGNRARSDRKILTVRVERAEPLPSAYGSLWPLSGRAPPGRAGGAATAHDTGPVVRRPAIFPPPRSSERCPVDGRRARYPNIHDGGTDRAPLVDDAPAHCGPATGFHPAGPRAE